ncbi:MAG: hypothetical protein H7832_00840 [Magnetococcus sp. DMHC-6]
MPNTLTADDVWKMFQETNLLFKKNSIEINCMQREIKEMQKEWQIEIKEIQQDTRQTIKDLSRQVGDLTGKWGRFVENMVAPSCKTLFAKRGIPVHEVHQQVKAWRDDNRSMEVDILVVNSESVVVVEVKSTLKQKDVEDYIGRINQFKYFFPRFTTYHVFGAVAGMVVEEHANTYARQQGLFVIVQAGESVELANADNFIPRSW